MRESSATPLCWIPAFARTTEENPEGQRRIQKDGKKREAPRHFRLLPWKKKSEKKVSF
jgi:alkylated DNA repair dioxygenase AlkB